METVVALNMCSVDYLYPQLSEGLCWKAGEHAEFKYQGLSFGPFWALVKGAELEHAGTAVQAAFAEEYTIEEL